MKKSIAIIVFSITIMITSTSVLSNPSNNANIKIVDQNVGDTEQIKGDVKQLEYTDILTNNEVTIEVESNTHEETHEYPPEVVAYYKNIIAHHEIENKHYQACLKEIKDTNKYGEICELKPETSLPEDIDGVDGSISELGKVLGSERREYIEELKKEEATNINKIADYMESNRKKWMVTESTSPIDDSPSVTMVLIPKEVVHGSYRPGNIPMLMIRCVENKTTAFINIGAYLGYEHSTKVTTRLDKEKARKRNWTLSTNNKAVFAPGGYIKWIKSLMGHENLLVRVSPLSESTKTFEFNVSGLEDAILPLRKACHW